ncbi:NAD-dependent epimerase/dehydratase [Xylanimonas cellulosilytica DSM 15894]|uniref:NAD-dependent epimerase/dehydratase n=1 Tax=Xylanimonas cellulosilytica (strain DSM 15894 / JCM 12276 / CECT 5975 / KCTC 9989 / LMG 20990 / NBRC 107835 / XIL07) TaxID=446471 RepID=D1BYP6_XYLCX|nr:NAD(P)H-binding protein [Xylanimonas cellulosilytica]ACZ29971.1 NAD-dependent epimerase/dehydratase [Xylanimonas cellulosilytica DSM 15894]
MGRVAVTGGTGTLGRTAVCALRAAGHDVVVMSRRTAPGLATADLLTGAGVEAAFTGADVVLHLATSRGTADRWQTQTVVDAVRETGGTARVVYTSIVGVDKVPSSYYRTKLRCEDLLHASGLRCAVVRVTQFHEFLGDFFASQRFSPVLLTPDVPVQPVHVRDAAAALVRVVSDDAVGRLPDVAGPQVLDGRTAARAYRDARGWHRPVLPVRLPGRAFRAYGAGHLCSPDAAVVDGVTFSGWLREQLGSAALT